MEKFRKNFLLPAILIVAFFACALFLQTKKAPWVDECYTYYGISHNNWSEFVDSICSGVNFSPPLYFFLNWIIQLAFHLPIEALRIESAIWVSIGSFLIFLKCAKTWNFISAFLALTTVLLQSDLLIEQALEARHYGMFFAVACMTLLLFPTNCEFHSPNRKRLYFLCLLALGLTHYLGIVFCAVAGFVRFWYLRKNGLRPSMPSLEISCSVILSASYLALLYNQSSHLNTWVKANSVEALLSQYLGSALPLSALVIVICMLFSLPGPKVQNLRPDVRKKNVSPLLAVSALWLLVPLFFWILSHLSTLNLFHERYFIPKEAAFVILLTFGINRVGRWFGELKILTSRTLLIVPCMVSFGIFILNAKRIYFSLDPSINYHHWLLSKKEKDKISVHCIYEGDHLFFPNFYQKENGANYLLHDHPQLSSVYKRFSSRINSIELSKVPSLKEFHFFSTNEKLLKTFSKSHSLTKTETLNKQSPAKIWIYSKITP